MSIKIKDNITLLINNVTNSINVKFKESMQYQKIGCRKDKKIFSELDKKFPNRHFKNIDLYYSNEQSKWIFYIKNKELAKALYQNLNFNKVFGHLIEPLEQVCFIANEKNKEISYIACDQINDSEEYTQYILSNFYNIFTWVNKNFSTDNQKIYVDLKQFFYSFVECERGFITSLFLSLSLEPYELNHVGLERIIDGLIYFCDKDNDFSILEQSIQLKRGAFGQNVGNGIYLAEGDNIFNKLPVYLYVNIFKYAINRNCFNDLYDFFDSRLIEEAEAKLDKEEFVFDEKQLVSSLKKVSENDSFIVYLQQYNMLFHYYIQIKNNSELDSIKGKLEILYNKNFIPEYKILCSLQSDNNYIMYKTPSGGIISLSKYIKKIAFDEHEIMNTILLINNAFNNNSDLRSVLTINNDIDIADHIYIDVKKNTLLIQDISIIQFEKSDITVDFEYPRLILDIIKQYVEYNKCDIKDIYKCEFMKLFSPSFAKDVINYLTDGTYVSKGMIKKLKNTLSSNCERQIEFLENISLNDHELINRITFFNDITVNEMIENILQLQDDSSVVRKGDFVPLNELVKEFASKEQVYLSEKVIRKLFFDFSLTNNDKLLLPTKLIISKNYISNDKYRILGVVWNKSELYNVKELITKGLMDTPRLYCILIELLNLNIQYNYSIQNSNVDFSKLLVDKNIKVIFNCANINNSKELFRQRKYEQEEYYEYIIKVLRENEIERYIDDFSYLSYEELFGDVHDARTLKVVPSFAKCYEHNKWYVEGKMCSECQKIYVIDKGQFRCSIGDGHYEDKVGEFKYIKNVCTLNTPRFGSSCRYNLLQIKLGLEHGLYKRFNGIIPEKIAFSSEQGYKERELFGVICTPYDFSEIVNIYSFKAVQKLKFILLLYRNLLPSIIDGSFISSDERIFETIVMDKRVRGKLIIPNIQLLNCKAILSTDETFKNEQIAITKKVLASFLNKYVQSDEVLKRKLDKNDLMVKSIIEDIDNHSFSETHILTYLKSNNSYCIVHGMHYDGKNVVCPECINEGITSNIALLYSSNYFKSLKNQEPVYEGGEANLYYSNDKKQVQKIFKNNVDRSFKSKIIGKALQKAELIHQFNSEHDDIKIITIKNVLYSYENGVLQLKGYTEEYVSDSFKISSLKEKEFVSKKGYERKDIVELLIKLCKGIEFLHSIGAYIGDLNGGNVLIKNKTVYIIDVDGMSFDEVKNNVYTKLYIYPPSAKNKNITASDDWYSLAVQAFYYLTYSHPFRGVCDTKKIPINEEDRMTKGYSVIGNHGIKVPDMSIGWDFMPKYMLEFFLETFEGSKRESLLRVLEKFLLSICENELHFKEIVRTRPVKLSISENSYIDTDDNFIYKEEIKCSFKGAKEIRRSRNKQFTISFNDSTWVISDKTGNIFKFDGVYDSNLIYANNNSIFYLSDNNLFMKDDVGSEKIIREASEVCSIIAFGINKYEDSILVKKNLLINCFEIYINNELKIYIHLEKLDSYTHGELQYDEVNDNWIIILNGDTTKCIVINKKLSYFESEIPECIPNLKSSCFYGNVLYYMENGKIGIYNLSKKKLKKIECEIAKEDSNIQREGDKFIINNQTKSYMYYKT